MKIQCIPMIIAINSYCEQIPFSNIFFYIFMRKSFKTLSKCLGFCSHSAHVWNDMRVPFLYIFNKQTCCISLYYLFATNLRRIFIHRSNSINLTCETHIHVMNVFIKTSYIFATFKFAYRNLLLFSIFSFIFINQWFIHYKKRCTEYEERFDINTLVNCIRLRTDCFTFSWSKGLKKLRTSYKTSRSMWNKEWQKQGDKVTKCHPPKAQIVWEAYEIH